MDDWLALKLTEEEVKELNNYELVYALEEALLAQEHTFEVKKAVQVHEWLRKEIFQRLNS